MLGAAGDARPSAVTPHPAKNDMSTYLRKLYWSILWHFGVPIQTRSKYEFDKNWHNMARKDINIKTNWSFEFWDYRIKP